MLLWKGGLLWGGGKTSHQLGENCADRISDSKALSRIDRNPSKLDRKKPNSAIRKWAAGLHRHFSKEYTQMAKKPMRRDSTPSGSYRLKPQSANHHTPIRGMWKVLAVAVVGEDAQTPCLLQRCEMVQPFCKSVWQFLKYTLNHTIQRSLSGALNPFHFTNENLCLHTHLDTNVHRSVICNSSMLDTPPVSFNR